MQTSKSTLNCPSSKNAHHSLNTSTHFCFGPKFSYSHEQCCSDDLFNYAKAVKMTLCKIYSSALVAQYVSLPLLLSWRLPAEIFESPSDNLISRPKGVCSRGMFVFYLIWPEWLHTLRATRLKCCCCCRFLLASITLERSIFLQTNLFTLQILLNYLQLECVRSESFFWDAFAHVSRSEPNTSRAQQHLAEWVVFIALCKYCFCPRKSDGLSKARPAPVRRKSERAHI